MTYETYNQRTQPTLSFKNFNNWDSIPRAWYFAFASHQLREGSVRSLVIGEQRLVLFRTTTGKLGALDAFCPHMGTDLAKGKVRGEDLQCAFHHWRFATDGQCSGIPCQNVVPRTARIRSYAVEERYGAIWLFPDQIPDVPLIEIPGLEGQSTINFFGKPNTETSHHHISMINGLDAQHLRTVHNIEMDMELSVREDQSWVDYELTGDTPKKRPVERLIYWLLGPRYGYAMRYAQGSVAALNLMRGVHFKGWKWPELTMLFAYRPLTNNRSMTVPIFVTKKRDGMFGRMVARILIAMTRACYRFLKDEDSMIYNNIRFSPNNLLDIDTTVRHYIDYVEALQPSTWSKRSTLPRRVGANASLTPAEPETPTKTRDFPLNDVFELDGEL